DYSRETIRSVSSEWGGAQTIGGPILVIPVEAEITVKVEEKVIDPITGLHQRDRHGHPVTKAREVKKKEVRPSVIVYPGAYALDMTTDAETRKRGIFEVPVFTARTEMTFDFPADMATTELKENEQLLWDEAALHVYLGETKALRGAARLERDGAAFQLEPLTDERGHTLGVLAQIGDPRGKAGFSLRFGFNGAQSLNMSPVGRETQVSLSSDWPHPSFAGTFLPDNSTINDEGFSASWTIPNLARPLPQTARLELGATARTGGSFGVRFFQPNDFYQKAYRTGRYGILFIALTFLTVLLVEGSTGRPTHPVQYVLIGLVQSIFVLLMVSFAEHIGYTPAYLLASTATIGLLTLYSASALKLGKRSVVLGCVLALLYATLYMILRSSDYALLAGACLTFAALAYTMFATRNEDWYGEPRPRKPWFPRKDPTPAPQT
ncbi:MAG: cell envelope integrity protein CreD, partial [Pseudomonadota bacterium]